MSFLQIKICYLHDFKSIDAVTIDDSVYLKSELTWKSFLLASHIPFLDFKLDALLSLHAYPLR